VTRILHIVLNEFKPDNRVLKQCRTLVDAQYDVSIAALWKADRKQFELIDGVKVFRYKLKTAFFPKLNIFLIFKYIEFTIYILKNFRSVNVIHCHDLGPLPIAFLIKMLFHKKLKIIYDAHEYQCHRHNITTISRNISYFLERTLTPRVNAFITVSNSISKCYGADYAIDAPTVILNVPGFQSKPKSNLLRTIHKIPVNHTIFLYQGLLGYGRGIENILAAMKKLKDHPVSFVFMGYGPLSEDIIKSSYSSQNIFFQSAVSQSVLLDYTASADYGVNLTVNTCLSRYYALPNKLFEYTMAGIPSIVSDHYERATFVKQNNVGHVVEDNNIDAIVETFKKVSTCDSSQFNASVQNVALQYNWEIESRKLLDLYARL